MIESYYRCRGVECPMNSGCARHTSPPPVINPHRGHYMTGFWRTRIADNNRCFIPNGSTEIFQMELPI